MNSQAKKYLVSGLVLAGVVVVGQWWLSWPERTTERFVSLASSGQYQDAGALLAAPSTMTVEADGGLLIQDRNGHSVNVPKGRLPLLAGQTVPTPLGERGPMDRLSGRDRFAMAATGHSQPEPREGAATTLFLTVERGRVHIDRME